MPYHANEVELSLKPSHCWLMLTMIMIIVALLAVCLINSFVLKIIIFFFVGAYLYVILTGFFRRHYPAGVSGIRYRGNSWWIMLNDKKWQEVSIKEPPLISAFLTVLIVSCTEKKTVPIVIFYDSADPNMFRRLRLLLRLTNKI